MSLPVGWGSHSRMTPIRTVARSYAQLSSLGAGRLHSLPWLFDMPEPVPDLVDECPDPRAFQTRQELRIRELGAPRRSRLGRKGLLDEAWIQVELIEQEVVRVDDADTKIDDRFRWEVLGVERDDDLADATRGGGEHVSVLWIAARTIDQSLVAGHPGIGERLLHMADPVLDLIRRQTAPSDRVSACV